MFTLLCSDTERFPGQILMSNNFLLIVESRKSKTYGYVLNFKNILNPSIFSFSVLGINSSALVCDDYALVKTSTKFALVAMKNKEVDFIACDASLRAHLVVISQQIYVAFEKQNFGGENTIYLFTPSQIKKSASFDLHNSDFTFDYASSLGLWDKEGHSDIFFVFNFDKFARELKIEFFDLITLKKSVAKVIPVTEKETRTTASLEDGVLNITLFEDSGSSRNLYFEIVYYPFITLQQLKWEGQKAIESWIPWLRIGITDSGVVHLDKSTETAKLEHTSAKVAVDKATPIIVYSRGNQVSVHRLGTNK